MITEIILSNLNEAKLFSVLADEATDSSNVDQMAIVTQFVDEQFTIREEFLGFVQCVKGLTGEALNSSKKSDLEWTIV